MKVTKFVHSCLLVEENGKRFLVDPGSYSWNSKMVSLETLASIDAVVITHGHPDHLHPDFAVEIHKQSPEAAWYGPAEVVQILKQLGISGNSLSSDDSIRFVESQHADLSPTFLTQPDHTSFVLFGEVLIGGDCHTLTDSCGAKYFAAAVNGGPWGSFVGFAKMIQGMKNRPKYILPLHDWHWNTEAREAIYKRMPEVLVPFNVNFIPLQNGEPQELPD